MDDRLQHYANIMIMNNKARASILMHIKIKGALQNYSQAAKGISMRKEFKNEIKLFELIN